MMGKKQNGDDNQHFFSLSYKIFYAQDIPVFDMHLICSTFCCVVKYRNTTKEFCT